MSAPKPKVTLKSLQFDVNIFKEELKATKEELNHVKKDLKAATDEIKLLKEVRIPKRPENTENDIECTLCDNAFGSRKSLKVHIASNHKKKITCKSCDETFVKNSDFELHVKGMHASTEKFECEKCDKSFVLKWRLRKHQEIHDSSSVKKCHYFNNKKFCPF